MQDSGLQQHNDWNFMKWQDVESFLDNSGTFKALPINSRRTASSKVSAYESSIGRHMVLERRGSSGVARMYFEEPFDFAKLNLSLESQFKSYKAGEARADIGRATKKLDLDKSIACVKVACEADLKKILASESAA